MLQLQAASRENEAKVRDLMEMKSLLLQRNERIVLLSSAPTHIGTADPAAACCTSADETSVAAPAADSNASSRTAQELMVNHSQLYC
jgi:hypothetical protein